MLTEILTPQQGVNSFGEHREVFRVPHLTPTLFPHKSLLAGPEY